MALTPDALSTALVGEEMVLQVLPLEQDAMK